MANTLIISASPDEAAGADRGSLARAAAQRGWRVLLAPPLYHLTSDADLWRQLRSETGPLAVAGDLHPRSVQWLLRARGVDAEPLAAADLRAAGSAEELLDELEARLGAPDGAGPPGQILPLEEPMAERWYPVLDQERCQGCGHCLQYCLFGVYELDAAGRVVVAQPDRCKPGCPACSRICPQGAILFPLYAADPAIAGAPGTLMSPDAEAQRLYAARTGAPLEGPAPAHLAEIDALIDALDDLGRRGA